MVDGVTFKEIKIRGREEIKGEFNNTLSVHKAIEDTLRVGDLILTSKYKNKTASLSPSHIKHISVYWGKGTLNKIKQVQWDILNGGKESSFLNHYNIFIRENILAYIDRILLEGKINNEDNYIMEIQTSDFVIQPLRELLKGKNEIFIYRPLLKHPRTFAGFYFYFMGNKYRIVYRKGERYCFESILSLMSIMADDFGKKTMKIDYIKGFTELSNTMHYNSLSITKNENIKLVLMYKQGFLRIIS